MPRYFFHVEDGADIPDEDGSELPDLAAARREAVRFSGAVLRETSCDVWSGEEWKLTVADDAGRDLFLLRFSAAELAPA